MQLAVHYAEIGLKGRNRPRFEKRLRENLKRALRPLATARVSNEYGRLVVELPDDLDAQEVYQRISSVFGIAYFSPATIIEPTVLAIEAAVDEFVAMQEFESFGVRVRRVEKSFPMHSNELSAHLGARVVAKTGARVDLSDPDLWIEIHVLSRQAILLQQKIAGLGGLPVGTAGRAVSLISGGIDSPVASFEMMRRGLELCFVHFHSAPFTDATSQDKVRDLVSRLAIHQGRSTLFMVPFGELQQQLASEAPAEPRIVLYRRFMLRIAERLANRVGALGLVTGESLGQVSSQTLANLDSINRVAELPVLRPLVGFDKADIIHRAKEIDTFETSIEPDEDCCSHLMPLRPATWTRPDAIEAIESRLDVKGMIENVLEKIQEERIEPLR